MYSLQGENQQVYIISPFYILNLILSKGVLGTFLVYPEPRAGFVPVSFLPEIGGREAKQHKQGKSASQERKDGPVGIKIENFCSSKKKKE